MARKDKRPTDAELEILNSLWELGPSTVRQVHKHLSSSRKIGSTTVLKLMQIMTDKGILRRDESVRPQIFAPAHTMRRTQKQLLGDLMERVFKGSSGSLVLEARAAGETTADERSQIRELLDQMESGPSRPEPENATGREDER